MYLTPLQTVAIILAVALGTMATRFAPFALFPQNKKPPEIISYLGRLLPPAMMGLMVVYCLKGVDLSTAPYGFAELISVAVVVALHLWKGKVLLSIGGGTILYMFLVQTVVPGLGM